MVIKMDINQESARTWYSTASNFIAPTISCISSKLYTIDWHLHSLILFFTLSPYPPTIIRLLLRLGVSLALLCGVLVVGVVKKSNSTGSSKLEESLSLRLEGSEMILPFLGEW